MHDSPDTRTLENAPEVTAPDGSTVRPLCRITGLGSFAHFQLEAGEISTAVSHRTVQEIWYIIGGAGCMWRQQEGDEPATVELAPGVCLTIPLGTTFQFRASDDTGEPLRSSPSRCHRGRSTVTMRPGHSGAHGHPRFPRNGARGHVPAQVMDQLAVRIGQALRLDP